MTANGVDYRVINYLKEPLSAAALKRLLASAGLTPLEALRTKEHAYRQHVAGKNLSDDQLFRVMAEHPELIQRPIVAKGDKAVLARSVEKLGELGIKS